MPYSLFVQHLQTFSDFEANYVSEDIHNSFDTPYSGPGFVGQVRPLLTEDVDITPPGRIEISAGTDFFQDAKFPLSGFKGDLTRVGDIRVRTGYAEMLKYALRALFRTF